MAHYQGCTVKSSTSWPTPEEISLGGSWWTEGVTSAYVMVGNQVRYYNDLGEVKAFPGVELTDEQQAMFAQGDDRNTIKITIESINALIDYSPYVFRVPVKAAKRPKRMVDPNFSESFSEVEPEVEPVVVPGPLTLRVIKAKDGRQHTEYLLDTAQEQAFWRFSSNKTLNGTNSSLVTIVQTATADYFADSALAHQRLEITEDQVALAKLNKTDDFMSEVRQLTAYFTELETLINNAPQEQAVALLQEKINQFNHDLQAKLDAMVVSLRGNLAAQELLAKFQRFTVQRIAAFTDQLKKFSQVPATRAEITRLFCIQDIGQAQNTEQKVASIGRGLLQDGKEMVYAVANAVGFQTPEAVPTAGKIHSLGKLETDLVSDLLAVSIQIGYALSANRGKQLYSKDSITKHLARAKEAVRIRGDLYGVRTNNAKEAIEPSMLAQQRLVTATGAGSVCRLLVSATIPTLDSLTDIPELENAAYIWVRSGADADQLYYVNKARGECECLSDYWSEEKIKEVIACFAEIPNPKGLDSVSLDLTSKDLTAISNVTGHSTKRWVSAEATVRFAGDLDEQHEQLCLLTNQDAEAKRERAPASESDYFVIRGFENTWRRVLRPVSALIYWPAALIVEVLASAMRVVTVGVTTLVAFTGFTQTAQKWDALAAKAHSGLSARIGYTAAKSFANKHYQRTGNDSKAIQAVLDQYKESPDNVFGEVCDQYLHGPKTAEMAWDQLKGAGRALTNVIREPWTLLGNNRLSNVIFKPDWKVKGELSQALVNEQMKKIFDKLTEYVNALSSPVVADGSDIAATVVVDASDAGISYSTAPKVIPLRKANNVSGADFFDDVLVKGLCHTLLNEMLEEAPLAAPLLFMLSLASMGVMVMPIAGLSGLTYAPSILGKAFTGQAANTSMMSQSVASFLQFKLGTASTILAAKLYEGDKKFLKGLGNHPEALLAYAALVAVGYGIGCIPLLPTSIHVPQTVLTPTVNLVDPGAILLNALTPEAAAAIRDGLVPVNSLELAFIGLKSLLLLESLVSGRHHAKFNEADSAAIQSGLVRILQAPADKREELTILLLKKHGIVLSKKVLELKVVKSFFANLSGKSAANQQASVARQDAASEPTHNHDLAKAQRALQAQLILLAEYDALGIKVPKGRREATYNYLDELCDKYNLECRKLGRHDKQINKDDVLNDFFLKYRYKGSTMISRVLSTPIALVWRPIKSIVTNSALVRKQVDFSNAKDGLFWRHLPVILVSEPGRMFVKYVNSSVRILRGMVSLPLAAARDSLNSLRSKEPVGHYKTAVKHLTEIRLHDIKAPLHEERKDSYAASALKTDLNNTLGTSVDIVLSQLDYDPETLQRFKGNETDGATISVSDNQRHERAALKHIELELAKTAVVEEDSDVQIEVSNIQALEVDLHSKAAEIKDDISMKPYRERAYEHVASRVSDAYDYGKRQLVHAYSAIPGGPQPAVSALGAIRTVHDPLADDITRDRVLSAN